ncbi:MAG: hypothetical protein KDK30_07535 [Leptospiraceae bacterium]|nr:hypothetical protein [Leptospiraceae bacterium]MCB1314589.1 hypothetical protein [Leptospiraceae bacterium]MCB1322513.1 hypothetical protein [Leptospiraceae bacterium]
MKINTRAFIIAFTTIFAVLILLLTVWTRLSTQFGAEFMAVFNSVHPHPYRATVGGLQWHEEVFGAAIDFFYAVVDSLIFSLAFSSLYNWVLSRSDRTSGNSTEE